MLPQGHVDRAETSTDRGRDGAFERCIGICYAREGLWWDQIKPLRKGGAAS